MSVARITIGSLVAWVLVTAIAQSFVSVLALSWSRWIRATVSDEIADERAEIASLKLIRPLEYPTQQVFVRSSAAARCNDVIHRAAKEIADVPTLSFKAFAQTGETDVETDAALRIYQDKLSRMHFSLACTGVDLRNREVQLWGDDAAALRFERLGWMMIASGLRRWSGYPRQSSEAGSDYLAAIEIAKGLDTMGNAQIAAAMELATTALRRLAELASESDEDAFLQAAEGIANHLKKRKTKINFQRRATREEGDWSKNMSGSPILSGLSSRFLLSSSTSTA
ncbi:MAG: hypothetical protein NVSMB1_22690 [Polyangiales bacterium]